MNVLKASAAAQAQPSQWDETSVFDADKDKTKFRQYEDACDRVKDFYAVSTLPHGSTFFLDFLGPPPAYHVIP